MAHDDLREAAINAIANYMHHRIFDEVSINMRPFLLKSAGDLLDTLDRTISKGAAAARELSVKGDRHAA